MQKSLCAYQRTKYSRNDLCVRVGVFFRSICHQIFHSSFDRTYSERPEFRTFFSTQFLRAHFNFSNLQSVQFNFYISSDAEMFNLENSNEKMPKPCGNTEQKYLKICPSNSVIGQLTRRFTIEIYVFNSFCHTKKKR